MIVFVFTLSMFLSAVLLFLVEPMLAKMMLPLLGGTPAVWNTCLVFFQGMLLAGYLYAHTAMKLLPRRVQIALHLALVLLPLAMVGLLPLHLPSGWEPPTDRNPAPWIFAMLMVVVGLPFFALASNTPILQRWFADSGHKTSADPYFLYAASNAGSLAGLIAYPTLFEPLLHLSMQSRLWSIGYMVFVAMTAACVLMVWKKQPAKILQRSSEVFEAKERRTSPLLWIALAFVPSSLMLGVTTAITTDVPAIPLFWVLPLAVYLISFVLVFAKRPPIPHAWVVGSVPFLILFALFPVFSRLSFSFSILLALYLLLLFGVAMYCHGELARGRPEVSRLTEFYLWMSLGGVLGGIFNSLIAPVVFHSVLEFPLVLIFAALLLPRTQPGQLANASAVWTKRKDWLLPLALGVCMLSIILGAARAGVRPGLLALVLFFAYSMLWCLSFRKRPVRFAAGIAAMLIACSFYTGSFGEILDTERSFFGVVRVSNDSSRKFRYLIHGGTFHGIQSLDPAKSREPLAYYSRSGPAGQIVRASQSRMPQGDWALVGLGAGAMACYQQPGQSLTYYEIDPLVVKTAEDPRYFTFLSQCAPNSKIVLGDARLKIQDAPDGHFSLIVLDAFSGDSIPIHLLTREALALYKRKLAPGGIIAFHISSNFVRLAPVLGALAQDGHLLCMIEEDRAVTEAEAAEGKSASIWVAMAASRENLDPLLASNTSSAQWLPLKALPNATVWTDDYSNLLSVIKWKWS